MNVDKDISLVWQSTNYLVIYMPPCLWFEMYLGICFNRKTLGAGLFSDFTVKPNHTEWVLPCIKIRCLDLIVWSLCCIDIEKLQYVPNACIICILKCLSTPNILIWGKEIIFLPSPSLLFISVLISEVLVPICFLKTNLLLPKFSLFLGSIDLQC